MKTKFELTKKCYVVKTNVKCTGICFNRLPANLSRHHSDPENNELFQSGFFITLKGGWRIHGQFSSRMPLNTGLTSREHEFIRVLSLSIARLSSHLCRHVWIRGCQSIAGREDFLQNICWESRDTYICVIWLIRIAHNYLNNLHSMFIFNWLKVYLGGATLYI